MQPYYTIAGAVAVGGVLLIGLIVARSRRRTKAAADTLHDALERAQNSESDVAQLRLAKFEVERRLGIEEQRAARIPEMEKALTASATRIEASRQAAVAAESATAVSNEAVKRLEDSLKETSQRLLAAERMQNDLQGRIDALKDEKAQMEQVLTAKAEAADRVEMTVAELRERLSAVEQAREAAALHIEQAAREKADLEGNLASAEAQLAERVQRIEALNEELHQTAAQLEAAREAKALADSSAAAAREASSLADSLHGDTRQRLVAAEQSRDQVSARLSAALEEKALAEASAAAAREATSVSDTLHAETRQRLAALEQARDQASARLATALEEKALAEASAVSAREATNVADTLHAETRQRLTLAEQARDQASERLAAALDEKTSHEIAAARAGAQLLEKSERAEALAEDLHLAHGQLDAMRGEASDQRARLAALAESLEQERKHGAEKLAMLTEVRERMTQEFRQLAEDVMRRHSENIASQNRAQVEMVLTPLRERLAEFQQGLASAHEESRQERVALAEQIQQLTDSSTQMTAETQQLTLALKGKAKGLGAWGEMLLTSILERSGLTAGEDYAFRECYSEDGSERLRPDVVINLPGDERIVIDSKVPLTSFEAYVNAENDAESEVALASHAAIFREHITALAASDHRPAAEKGRGFAVMFVPVEGALAAALRRDPELTALAVDGHVALATPATLMMALRAVANVWQVERRNRRAEEIADRAGKLYDSFAGYLGDMELLGDYLLRARHAYEEALNKLSSGRDNLMNQVEQLKEMGAATKRTMPVLSSQGVPEPPPPPPEFEAPLA